MEQSTIPSVEDSVQEQIVRHVKVNRTRLPFEVLRATGFYQSVDGEVLAGCPRGEAEEADVFFFNLGRTIVCDGVDLAEEYALRALKPADLYVLAAVNEADPTFAYIYPNGTFWVNLQNENCYAIFYRLIDQRWVDVGWDVGNMWGGDIWFAGVRC